MEFLVIRPVFLRENNFQYHCWHLFAGLTIEFYLEQEEYLAELTESAGIRLSIHPQNIMPFPQDDSILVAPATLTFVSLTMVRYC